MNRRPLARPVTLVMLAVAASSVTAGEDCFPPPNETCANPTVFTNADLPYEITRPLGCVNDIIDKPYFDIFYRFDCTRTGDYLMHMCGSSGDTYLRIYTDGCGWDDGVELGLADQCRAKRRPPVWRRAVAGSDQGGLGGRRHGRL